ncbi:endonuclease/exonuclease/phosphatase family protein [Streptomyces violaceusniger]|uniref:endonuclease/exonuclease/phosphatase family protein n=1 Tax=Streptomyces violaceusniger TaxID=68280 RepID=UPI0037F8F60E
MTFNLRYAGDSEPNSWGRRRPVMRELLRRARPHLLGTQEGLYGQLRDIAHDLGQRALRVDRHRTDGGQPRRVHGRLLRHRAARARGVRPLLAVRHPECDRLQYLGRGRGPDGHLGALPRPVDRQGVLRPQHPSGPPQPERPCAAALITERLGGLDSALPRIVTGDFNVAAHGNPVYDAMLNGGTLVDSWDTAERRGPLYGTFHGFGPLVPDGDRIDWILTSPGVRTHHAVIDTYSGDGQYPSDHLPVRTVLEL